MGSISGSLSLTRLVRSLYILCHYGTCNVITSVATPTRLEGLRLPRKLDLHRAALADGLVHELDSNHLALGAAPYLAGPSGPARRVRRARGELEDVAAAHALVVDERRPRTASCRSNAAAGTYLAPP